MSEEATDPAVIAEREACARIVHALGREMNSTAVAEVLRAKRWTCRCANCRHEWGAEEEWSPVVHRRAYCTCCGRVYDLVACPSCGVTAEEPTHEHWQCAPCTREAAEPEDITPPVAS